MVIFQLHGKVHNKYILGHLFKGARYILLTHSEPFSDKIDLISSFSINIHEY